MDIGRGIFGNTRCPLEETLPSDDLLVDFKDAATKDISRCYKGIHGEHHHVQRRVLAEDCSRPRVRLCQQITLGRHPWGNTLLTSSSRSASTMRCSGSHAVISSFL